MESDYFIEDLEEELPMWEEKKILTKQQIEKIRKLYEKKKEEKKPKDTNYAKVLMIIASIIIGFGVILFVASNWKHMNAFLKISILVIATLGTLITGYLYDKKNYWLSQSLYLLSTLIYGASIFLIAQIYNISGISTSGLFLTWLIGTLVITLFLKAKVTLFINPILAFIWFISASINKQFIAMLYPIIILVMLYYAKSILKKDNFYFGLSSLALLLGAIFSFIMEKNYFTLLMFFGFALIYAFYNVDEKGKHVALGLITSIFSIFLLFICAMRNKFAISGHPIASYIPLLILILIPIFYYFKEQLSGTLVFSTILLVISGFISMGTRGKLGFLPIILYSLIILGLYLYESKKRVVSDIVRQVILVGFPITAFLGIIKLSIDNTVVDFISPILVIIMFYIAYKEESALLATTTLIASIIWSFFYFIALSETLGFTLKLNGSIGLVYTLTVGLLLINIGLIDKKFKPIYLGIGGLISIPSFILTFNNMNRSLLSIGREHFFFISLIISIITIIISGRNAMNETSLLKSWSLFIGLSSIAVIVMLFFPVTVTIIMNLIFFVALLGFISTAFVNKLQGLFNFSLILMVIYLVIRYFDFAWKLFDRSLFFIITGIILLIGSVLLEKFRKKAISEMK